ncbi:adenylate/guanylate cyclase domain-containing protein [Aerosakkonema funiforme]|uniref:adenylate/guanylate cyclase domain-containing protein n=1 Tax=Aerosakkonema funiforme TaxID=1246630 RepID=UPI0035B7A752
MQKKQPIQEHLLLEIEKLRQEVEHLRREKANLRALLEEATQHSDTIEADLHDKALSVERSSERKLAKFLDAMPMGVFVVDATGKPYYANQMAQYILGKRIAPETGIEQFPDIYQTYLAGTDLPYPSERQPLWRALQGESTTIEDLEIRRGDKIIPLEVWATPIFDENGQITYAIAVFQDITERKRAEIERSEFTNQLLEINSAYERFVPRQFLQFLNKESIVEVKLGDNIQQEMSVLFADIRNFTTLSERMTPSENFKFINSYLSCMESAIAENHGFIDKYIGDAIMALFSQDADNALKAGIAMLHRLNEYNQHWQSVGYDPISIGIGINSGSLMLGTVGSPSRMNGTVISDAVNLASRIESLTKYYDVSLLISHHTYLRLPNPDIYAIRTIDRVKVKGKSETVSIFEVFDADPPEIREGKLATATVFEQALLLYNQDNYVDAEQMFRDCLSINPLDKVAQIYLERCQLQLLYKVKV